ncbi:hypothetical protein GGX14DRAFT_576775 [Mycena pura]|uniref:Zn(2)-C6 fungal-type domain-containing protein n=1 Tax=Mycena pura TaxID=153505 RepID=A0AAD6USY0_9AGAR|nr:hypothetical protein GGX14DRAFT_576775 [Mycena pura]
MKPAKFKTPTCALCRRRKLRCDGGDPCGPCSRTRTPVVCTYVPKTVGQLRSDLPKGGACIICRQRKRKCDGNLPCLTCTQSERPDDCKYRDKPLGSALLKPPMRRAQSREESTSDSASTSSNSLSRPTTPADQERPYQERLPYHYVSSDLGLQCDTDYSELFELNDQLLPWAEFAQPPECYSEHSSSLSDSPMILPTLDEVPFPPMPQACDTEPWIVRNLLLEHRFQYGLNITAEKHDAISRGDHSGRAVDPTLVDVCQLLGYILRYHPHQDGWLSFNSHTAAELELDVRVRDALERGAGPAPLVALQTCSLLSLYYALKEDVCGCQEFLVKASGVVLRHAAAFGLGLARPEPAALELSPKFDASYLSPRTEAEETRAALAQLVYLDILAILLFQFPSSIDPQVVAAFRRLASEHPSETTSNFLRAKSFMFLTDSQQLVAAWRRWNFGDAVPPAWSKRYRTLIDDIHAHLAFLNTVALDVSYIPALHDAQPTLKLCSIAALAALVELHNLFADTQPEARRKSHVAVDEIARITQGLQERDYAFLGPGLSAPWSIASRTAATAGWESPPDGRFSQAALFFGECNRKLRRVSPYALPL